MAGRRAGIWAARWCLPQGSGLTGAAAQTPAVNSMLLRLTRSRARGASRVAGASLQGRIGEISAVSAELEEAQSRADSAQARQRSLRADQEP